MQAVRPLKHPVNGATLVLVNVGKWDPSVASFDDLILGISFLLEELLLTPSFQLHGCHAIYDLSGFGVTHLWQLSYSRLKIMFKIILVRIKERQENEPKKKVLIRIEIRSGSLLGLLESISSILQASSCHSSN